MDDRELASRIQQIVLRGMNTEEGDVTNVRQNTYQRYYGEQLGNEREGYSKYVSREVLETVEWCLPALLRVFTSGKNSVEFSATGEMDVDQAKHETEVVNYWFHEGSEEDNTGFLTLYTWLKDILMYPNGYVKVIMEEKEDQETVRYQGLNEMQLEELRADDDNEIEIEQEYEQVLQAQAPTTMSAPGVFADAGFEASIKLYDVKVTATKMKRSIEVVPIPPDECIIEHGHTKLDLDSAKFVAHRVRKTRSELIEEGYDPAMLEDISPDNDETCNDERVVRLFYEDENPEDGDAAFDTPADQSFWVYECYTNVDYDDDGIAERRRIVMIGHTILENEPDEYTPIVAASAIHVTHKHIGLSLAETVLDLQNLITTLTRQLLDNIYKQNIRRKYLSEQALAADGSTFDDMVDGRSEVILVRGDPNAAVAPEQVQSIVGEIGATLEQFRELPKMRSGVAPQLSLDPSVLEKSTMGAFMGAMDEATQRLELIVRLFAETGLKRVFTKIHYLLRTYFDEPMELQIDGQWTQASPSQWAKRAKMGVSVGVGFNSRQALVPMLTQILEMQREAAPHGLSDPKKIHNTLAKLIEASALGDVDSFFNDPAAPDFQPPEPQPDPQTILAEAQAKSLEADAQRKDAELQDKIQQNMAKMQAEIQKVQGDADYKIAELQSKIEAQAEEIRLKDQQYELDRDAAPYNNANTEADTLLKMAQIRKIGQEPEERELTAQREPVERRDEQRETV